MIYASTKQNKKDVLNMISVGEAAFAKKLFYRKPKKKCFKEDASFSPAI
nr:hypothetical protein [Mucilaginibacter sp. FT3.2]